MIFCSFFFFFLANSLCFWPAIKRLIVLDKKARFVQLRIGCEDTYTHTHIDTPTQTSTYTHSKAQKLFKSLHLKCHDHLSITEAEAISPFKTTEGASLFGITFIHRTSILSSGITLLSVPTMERHFLFILAIEMYDKCFLRLSSDNVRKILKEK